MSKMWIPLSMLALSMGSGAAQAQEPSADEQAVEELAARYEEAWKSGDAKAVADVYTEDATVIEPTGKMAQGRSEIEKVLAETLAMYEGSEIQIERTSLRFIKPGLAVSDGTWTVTGAAKPEKGEGPPMEGQYTVVATKQDSGWKLAASQGRVPVSPPPPSEQQ